MINDDRSSREQASRAAELHTEIDFENDSLLSTNSVPVREGYTQRWVRTSINNEDDQKNVFRSMNKGWKPRRSSSVIRGAMVPMIHYEGADIIGIRGMILMERPTEIHIREQSYERQLTDNLMSGVKHNLHSVHDSRSGITRPEFTKNQSSVKRGRVAPIADD